MSQVRNTKQNRKAPRRNRRTPSYRIKGWIVAALFVTFIISVAYSTCSKNRHDDGLAGAVDGMSAESLVKVIDKTDYTGDAEMLNYPGFDVYFSHKHHQPYYSAWILTPEHAASQSYSRSNNFRADGYVNGSAKVADYRRSGFDRGHMAPSGDFRYDDKAQNATFYLTNISPQRKELNTKAWANLEEQCRSWAKRDSTLIIITGPILNNYLTQTIGNTGVTVPDRYFKVILAPYANPPRAIGFIMPNSNVPGGVQAAAVTVDQVEEVTGFDFFSSLPDDIEAEVESQARYSKWQYSNKRK